MFFYIVVFAKNRYCDYPYPSLAVVFCTHSATRSSMGALRMKQMQPVHSFYLPVTRANGARFAS